MRLTRFHGTLIAVLALLLVPGFVSTTMGADDFTPLAGKWAGPVVWADGSTGTTQWTIDADGLYTMQTDTVTLSGRLQKQGDRYTFVMERAGQAYSGTVMQQDRGSRSRLVGRGRNANGPFDFVLTRV